MELQKGIRNMINKNMDKYNGLLFAFEFSNLYLMMKEKYNTAGYGSKYKKRKY